MGRINTDMRTDMRTDIPAAAYAAQPINGNPVANAAGQPAPAAANRPARALHISMAARCAKRLFDIVGSLVSLILFSPLMLAIYAAIKCGDRGSAIFSQERIGYRGKPFTLYKFRSMKPTAEADGRPALCAKADDRLTRVGRFLRDHHLDELPQLWNVLRGDMSFVGYRPERRYFIDQIMALNPDYRLLYSLRPGLFSKATLYNGYTDTMEKMLERLRMDLDYLYTRSMMTDLKIIYLTAVSIITGKKF